MLKYLDIDISQLEKTAYGDGIRLEFEHGLTVELHEPNDQISRLSARVCRLGQAMGVQENQLSKSLHIYEEIVSETPVDFTLAVSDTDTCLRCLSEKRSLGSTGQEAYDWLVNFVDEAYAFKKVFLSYETPN